MSDLTIIGIIIFVMFAAVIRVSWRIGVLLRKRDGD